MFIKFLHLYTIVRHICHNVSLRKNKDKNKMVWINIEGRIPMCETGINGHVDAPMKPCHSTISGHVTDWGKDKNGR